jgi:type II secretory pathway pseudopilin PulG
MKSRHSSPTSRAAGRRRGHTLVETLIASAITVIALSGLGTTVALSGRMQQQVTLLGDSSQAAALALQRMVLDIREAKEVDFVTPSRFRVYFPAMAADGRYDRYRTDYDVWVEYARSDAAGTPSDAGSYLWRRTNANSGRPVCRDISGFQATSNSDDTVRVTLAVAKSSGRYSQATRLSQRVIYLRNH